MLIVAKNDKAHKSLAMQIKAHSFTREYEAVVAGRLKCDQGTVDAPIGRHPVHRKKMAVLPIDMLKAGKARNAVTHFKVINRYRKYTHISLRLETGRTHQIRVHMAVSVIRLQAIGVRIKPIPAMSARTVPAREIYWV